MSASAFLRVLDAAHDAADELDKWDGDASSSLDGCSPGGVVRHAVHEAARVSIDECPSCLRARDDDLWHEDVMRDMDARCDE